VEAKDILRIKIGTSVRLHLLKGNVDANCSFFSVFLVGVRTDGRVRPDPQCGLLERPGNKSTYRF